MNELENTVQPSVEPSNQTPQGIQQDDNGNWSITPPEHAMHSRSGRSPIERAYNEVMDYVEKHGRTIQEEFELIQQKKSSLSKRLREFVELLIEIEKYNPSGEEKPSIPNE